MTTPFWFAITLTLQNWSRGSGPAVGDNLGLVSELPNVRAVSTVHLESARRRSEVYHQRIDVLPHILIAKARGNFLARAIATRVVAASLPEIVGL